MAEELRLRGKWGKRASSGSGWKWNKSLRDQLTAYLANLGIPKDESELYAAARRNLLCQIEELAKGLL